MLTQVFNCYTCQTPFDCKEGYPRVPVFSHYHRAVCCRTCVPDVPRLQRGLMQFLDQSAFHRTPQGHEYTLPIVDPICFGCAGTISLVNGSKAFPTNCGHYLCKKCSHQERKNIYSYCAKCNSSAGGSVLHHPDRGLIDFAGQLYHVIHNMKTVEVKELKEKLNDRDGQIDKLKEENERLQKLLSNKETTGNGSSGTECDIKRPVERLYICEDCDRIICGDCNFDSHQIHSVSRILGTALDQLREKYDERYTETIEGIAINLESLQKNVNEAVRRVLIAGKERLSLINQSSKYEQAEKIVNNVETTTELLEKHCHEYFPAARKLATRLEELELQLKREQK